MAARNERNNAVIEKMLKPRSPTLGPQVLESRDNASRSKGATARANLSCRIEPHRQLSFGGVKVADIIDARARYCVEQIECRIPVGVDERHALPGVDVCHREIAHERRLAAPSFAGHINMSL